MIWYAYEKINMRIQVKQKNINVQNNCNKIICFESVCTYKVLTKNILKMKELSKEDYKKARAIIRKEEQSVCTESAYNTCVYVSRREQKRRLQKLWHKSAEEQMQEHYLQQEKQAFTLGTPIERNAFEMCKGTRMRKRVHNTLYKEQAGTCGTITHTMRFENSYITKVCKSRSLY